MYGNLNRSLAKQKSLGLLIIRIGLGIMFIIHGYPKLMGGPEMWEKLGGAMGLMGITFAPAFWGFMAAAAEGIGGLFLLLGIAFRPVCAFLAFTMLVAAMKHLSVPEEGLRQASHAIEVGVVFLGLIFVGPGKFSVMDKENV